MLRSHIGSRDGRQCAVPERRVGLGLEGLGRGVQRTLVPVAGLVTAGGELAGAPEVTTARIWDRPDPMRPMWHEYGTRATRTFVFDKSPAALSWALSVGEAGLEPAASCSQSRCATNCATPRSFTTGHVAWY